MGRVPVFRVGRRGGDVMRCRDSKAYRYTGQVHEDQEAMAGTVE